MMKNDCTNFPKAVIFDFDGLILDTESVELSVWLNLFKGVGLKFNIDAYKDSIGSYLIHPYRPAAELVKIMGGSNSMESIEFQVHQEAIEKLDGQPPLPGVLEIINKAKEKRLKLAIGSSSPLSWVKFHLKKLTLWDYFDAVVTIDDVNNCKPSPEIFLKIIELLKINPFDALVLEDSANGVLAAIRAGIPVIAVPNDITRGQDFSHASFCLNSLLELDLDDICLS